MAHHLNTLASRQGHRNRRPTQSSHSRHPNICTSQLRGLLFCITTQRLLFCFTTQTAFLHPISRGCFSASHLRGCFSASQLCGCFSASQHCGCFKTFHPIIFFLQVFKKTLDLFKDVQNQKFGYILTWGGGVFKF